MSVAPSMKQLVNRTPVIELLNLGVTVALTTDGSMLSSGFDMFDAMKRAQMVFRRAMNDEFYLPAEKLFEMTTIDAAKCVGMEHEVGSLSVGKRADVIAIHVMNPRLMPRFNLLDTLIGNGHPSDVEPVSYTHLDVYKRQKRVSLELLLVELMYRPVSFPSKIQLKVLTHASPSLRTAVFQLENRQF